MGLIGWFYILLLAEALSKQHVASKVNHYSWRNEQLASFCSTVTADCVLVQTLVHVIEFSRIEGTHEAHRAGPEEGHKVA